MDRRKLMTYDDISFAQAAYEFTLLQLNDPTILKPFADKQSSPIEFEIQEERP